MANYFDQFDLEDDEEKGGKAANKFDQFEGTDRGATRAAVQGFNSTVPFGNRVAAGLGAAGAYALSGNAREMGIGELYRTARADQEATSNAHQDAEMYGSLAGIAATLPAAFAGGASVKGLGFLDKASKATKLKGVANATTKAGTKVAAWTRGSDLAADASRIAKVGSTALRGAKTGAVGGATGAAYGFGNSKNDLDTSEAADDAFSGGKLGAAVGAAVPVAGAALGAAANKMLPGVSEGLSEVTALARKYNIPVSLDQVADSRVLKNVQKVSQELPFSGQSAFRERQMTQFQRELFKTVGVDAAKFTPTTMNTAFKKVGGEFDNLTKGKTFDIGGDFVDNLAATADDVASTYGNEAAQIFNKEASKVINDFKGDVVTGELISRQRARINALARNSTNPDIKGALLDLESNIVDGITSRDPALQKALTAAKQRYKNLIVLEPVAVKAKGGFISPALLNNRVSQVYRRAHTVGESGDIGNLARIGHELLPELGGSDTVQKALVVKALSYPGALITGNAVIGAPATAAVGAAGAGINRAFQAGINRNQKIIDKALIQQARKLPPAQAKQLLKKAGKP